METPLCRLRLDRQNGNLVGLAWKDPAREVIQEPRLGENFRILLPRPGYEANYFVSSEQQVSRIEKTDQGVTCVYEALRNARETLNVRVRYHIRAVDKNLEFAIEVDNPTDLPLAGGFLWHRRRATGSRPIARISSRWFRGGTTNLAASVSTDFRAGGLWGG